MRHNSPIAKSVENRRWGGKPNRALRLALYSSLAAWVYACGNSDDPPDPGNDGGSAGARAGAGAGGGPIAGTAGTSPGGRAGSGGGAVSAGDGGMAGENDGGASGAGDGGSAGSPDAGAGGSAGSPDAGAGGTPDAGAGGAPDAGTGGLGGEAGSGGATEPKVPPSSFSCSDLGPVDPGVTERHCFDFSDGASGFQPDGGEWLSTDGAYVGRGPEVATCPGAGSLMTASVISEFSATNVRVRARMASLDRVDKILVLRARDSANRVELNFRAHWEWEGTIYGGDLVIQELVDCDGTIHVAQGLIPISHELFEPIAVEVELRGQRLTVSVDGNEVFDDDVPILVEPGSVGFAVINDSLVHYDDLVVEVLE